MIDENESEREYIYFVGKASRASYMKKDVIGCAFICLIVFFLPGCVSSPSQTEHQKDDEQPRLRSYQTYEYNDAGNKIKSSWYKADGTVDTWIVFK